MTNDLKDILSLIAATVFADKRVFASEIDVFIQATSKLKIVRRLDPKISEAKLLVWYETNKDEIRLKLGTPYFKDWFYEILERLKDVPDKELILEVMRKISHADGNIHVSERALIALSERYWCSR
jgi:tellurite resistance protein